MRELLKLVNAPTGVIRMPVGDQGTVYRPPRVDIEITRGAINAVFIECQNRLLGHAHKLAGRRRLNRVGEEILSDAQYFIRITAGYGEEFIPRSALLFGVSEE